MKWSAFFFLLCLPTAYSSEPKTANRLSLTYQSSSDIGQFQLSVLTNEPVAGAQVDLTISLILSVDLTPGSAVAFIAPWFHQLQFQRVDPDGTNYLSYQHDGQSALFNESEIIQLRHFDRLETAISLPTVSYTHLTLPTKA